MGILGDKSSGLGGIAGTCAYRTTVYNSVNHGTVMTGSDAGYMGVGGLVGYFSGGNGMHIRYCCNRGTVDFPKSKEDYGCVGGILGKVEGAKKDDDNHILDCYNAKLRASKEGHLRRVAIIEAALPAPWVQTVVATGLSIRVMSRKETELSGQPIS